MPQQNLSATHYSIGIDPGLNGAFTLLQLSPLKVIWVSPTFTFKQDDGKSHYDIPQIASYLDSAINDIKAKAQTVTVCIERQHAMPLQGVVSMFTTGYGFGMWQGLFTMLQTLYPHVITNQIVVGAREWQKLLTGECAIDDTKAKSIARVHRLFPDVELLKTPKSRKDHDGMADAINIAHYCLLRMHS